MAALSVIGFLSGILGIVQFTHDNLPKQDKVGSKIGITVGLDVDNGLHNAGGSLPDVRLYNKAGGFLGITVDPGKVRSGEFGDITVEHNLALEQQATYALITANNDAICIAYAAIIWPSGDEYALVGDWGRTCGGCFWIDGNNDVPETAFQVHWPEFADQDSNPVPDNSDDKQDRIDHLCTAGLPFKFHRYPDTNPNKITYWVPVTPRSSSDDRASTTETARGISNRTRSSGFHSKRHYHHHSRTRLTNIRALCKSSTAFGPDLLNVQSGTFCRMTDRTTWPACDGADVLNNCFNLDINQLVLHGVTTRDDPYKKVIDWTGEVKHAM
ncbi:hypothetical protein F4802DRAFT_605946 [Xylaria palmicola]|nr:hypothetical protein F4802DRAFT_605946 [Xylaria palmicola]